MPRLDLIRQRVCHGERRGPVRPPLPRFPAPRPERTERRVVRDREQHEQHEGRRETGPVGEAEQVVAQRDAVIAVRIDEVLPELPGEVHLQSGHHVRECEQPTPDPDVAPEVRARRGGTSAPHAPRADQHRPRDQRDAHPARRHAQAVHQLGRIGRLRDHHEVEHRSGRENARVARGAHPFPIPGDDPGPSLPREGRAAVGRAVVHHDDVSDIFRDLLENGLNLPLHAVTGDNCNYTMVLKIRLSHSTEMIN